MKHEVNARESFIARARATDGRGGGLEMDAAAALGRRCGARVQSRDVVCPDLSLKVRA